MSTCKIEHYNSGHPVQDGRVCERCGSGPCEVWRGEPVPFTEQKPRESDPQPVENRPDPAYAAALSEQSILVEARAKAFELAMKLAAQSDQAGTIQFPGLIDVSNRILRYLLEGK